MYFTLTVCPCCGENDVEPDYELELSEPEYVVAKCPQCEFEEEMDERDHDGHVVRYSIHHQLFDQVPF